MAYARKTHFFNLYTQKWRKMCFSGICQLQNYLEKQVFNIFAWGQNMMYLKHISTQNFFFRFFACIACKICSIFAGVRFSKFELFRARCVHFFIKIWKKIIFLIPNFFLMSVILLQKAISQFEAFGPNASKLLKLSNFFWFWVHF